VGRIWCSALAAIAAAIMVTPAALGAWPLYWGGPSSDGCFGIAPTPNGEIAAVGYRNDGGNNRWRAALYSPTGSLVWERDTSLGSGSDARDVATDASGNVYVCGGYLAGERHGYTIKYAANGSQLWRGHLYNRGGGPDDALGVAAEAAGNAAFVGYIPRAGRMRWAVCYCNTNGVPQWWDTTLVNGDSSRARDVSIDRQGNVYVCGTVWRQLGANYGHKGYVVKYSNTGSRLWQGEFQNGDTTSDALGIATDQHGCPVIAGYYNPAGNNTWRVEKDTSSGSFMWRKTWNPGSGSEARAVTVDRNENIYVIGDYPNGNRTGRVIKYTPGGRETLNTDWSIGGGNHEPHGIMTVGPDVGQDLYTAGATDMMGSWDWVIQRDWTQAVEEPAQGSVPPLRVSCSPNPFGKQTTISYTLPRTCNVDLSVINAAGQTVTSLRSGLQQAGSYRISWRTGGALVKENACGLYFCRLRTGDYTATKMIVQTR